MHERDEEVDEIIAGVLDFLNDRPVVPSLDTPTNDSVAENIALTEVERFLHRFVQPHLLSIDEKVTEPDGIAPFVKKDFDDQKRNKVKGLEEEGAHGLASEISGLKLKDLAEKLATDMDEFEQRLADFSQTSNEYEQVERLIRKMNILQIAVDRAIELP